MYFFFKIFLFFFLFSSYSFAQNEINYKGKFGYLANLSSTIKYNNSQEALRIIVNDFSKTINSEFDLILYNTYDELITSYKNNQLNIMAVRPKHYLENMELIDNLSTKFFILTDGKDIKLDNLYLVSNSEKKIKDIKSLDKKKVLIKDNEYLSQIYFGYLTSKYKINSNNITHIDKFNTALLKVFFGEYDACVVPSYVYNTMLELNPSMKKKLMILDKSPKIFSNNIISISKNNSKDDLEKLIDAINKFKLTVKKDEIFNLLRVSDMFFLDNNEINVLRDFYLEYKRLTKNEK